ncbi:MAG: hypothetical protein LUH07_04890, partial [Lachnospiraceae bacterium]|nr:hypothetical protein [Lachnospiraceae bacterium]
TLEIHPEADGYLEKREDCARKAADQDAQSFVEATVAAIFNATAGLVCQEAGGVQAAFLVKPEQPQAGMLVPFLRLLKNELREQFTRVNADVYFMLDQSAFHEQRKEKEASIFLTLQEGEKLMDDHELRLAYLLSNVTNRGYLLEKTAAAEEQYASAALMIAMKDLIADNLAYSYSDREFGHGVANVGQSNGLTPGIFSSIGHMSLQTDEKFNALVVYRTVWESLGTTDPDLDADSLQQELGLGKNGIKQYFEAAVPMRALSQEDFDAIVRNRSREEQSIFTMTCGDAVAQFFGNNLALYQELNTPQINVQQKLNDWQDVLKKKLQALTGQVSFFDIALLLERAEADVHALIAEADEVVADRKNKLTQWENVTFAQDSGKIGKGVNPLYVLAQNYLKRKNALYSAQQQKKMIGGLQSKLHALGSCYRNYKNLVLETISGIDNEIKEKLHTVNKPGNGLGKLQITNGEHYYAEITRELVERDANRSFHRLTDTLRDILNAGDLQESRIFQCVQEYCKNQIFTDARFRMDFLNELQNRLMGYEDAEWDIRSGTQVSNFLLTSIVDTQHYLFFDRINQGFQAYEEMVLLLQSDSIFMEEKDNDAHVANTIKEQKMKLFCDKNSSSLDVLFLAGNLRPQNLHKWDLYQDAYEQLTGGGDVG